MEMGKGSGRPPLAFCSKHSDRRSRPQARLRGPESLVAPNYLATDLQHKQVANPS